MKKIITPLYAAHLLERNTHNRPIKPRYVDWLAQQMADGKWVYNGETIIIGVDGTLIDGQHRLSAVVKSGCTIESEVIEGVDPATFHTIDSGTRRTAGDAFYVYGVKEYICSASVTSFYWHLHCGYHAGLNTNPTVTRDAKMTSEDYYQVYVSHKEIFDAVVRSSHQMYKCSIRVLPVSKSGGYMAYMIIDLGHPLDLVRAFFSQVYGNEPTRSTKSLHRKLANALIKRTNIDAVTLHNDIINAFDKFRKENN